MWEHPNIDYSLWELAAFLDGMRSFDMDFYQTLDSIRLLYLSFIQFSDFFLQKKKILYVNLNIQMQDLELMKTNLHISKT